jgi:AraC-like DNA-binding protein
LVKIARWKRTPRHRSGRGRIEELGLSLAAYVLREIGTGVPRPRAAARDDVRAREQVYGTIARIELAELAGSLHLNPFRFLRLFKRETGVTPHRFLMHTRIRRAIALLRDTSRPVTDIAFDVDFGDLSNFINVFRREVGCSPGHYRRSGLSGHWLSRATRERFPCPVLPDVSP